MEEAVVLEIIYMPREEEDRLLEDQQQVGLAVLDIIISVAVVVDLVDSASNQAAADSFGANSNNRWTTTSAVRRVAPVT